MNKNFWRILVIAALIVIVLGSLFIKRGIIYVPDLYSFSFKPLHKLIHNLKDKNS